MFQKHVLIAKAIIVVAIGLLVGYALGVSFANDVAKSRVVTMEEYVADFERYKADLESSDIPMPGAIVIGVVMVFGAFSIYELLAFGVAKGLAAVGGRRASSSVFPPTPGD